MKPKLIAILSSLLITLSGYAQTLKDSLLSNGYLFEQFIPGRVLLKSGASEQAVLNYNFRDQSMAFEQNGRYLTVTNPKEVDTVYISEKKFIPIDGKFYEVILNNTVSLLNTYTESTHPIAATTDHNGSSKQDANQVSNTATGVYVSRNFKGDYRTELKKQYWLIKGNNLYKANNEKQVISRFPSKSSEITHYIKENNIKIMDEKDMRKLIDYCNSLFQ